MPGWFERLSALDAGFLDMERDRTAHMHVGMVAVFDGPPPTYQQLLAFVDSRLHRVPRYRQRLRFVPFHQRRPVWVDESQFDLEYHVRHTCLPPPGGEDQLKTLAARPCVPLVRTTSVGIALLSYDGAIGAGLPGDAERARDLPVLARALPAALDELRAEAN